MILAAASVYAGDDHIVAPGGTSKAAAFDIPSQPLATALDRYGDITGREVLYDTALAEGRRSSAVAGLYVPEAALRRLLDGTGLAARFMADGSFVLTLAGAERPVAVATPDLVRQQYYARIQASLRAAFCASHTARLVGRYRVAALLWISPAGNVERAERLGSAGTRELDEEIDEALRHVALGAPLPGFAQPVLVMSQPPQPGGPTPCDATQSRSTVADRP